VNNFLAWSGGSIPPALHAVTTTPAAMLGLEGVKGSLAPGADADLVVLSDHSGDADGCPKLVVDEVWKFGVKVFSAAGLETGDGTGNGTSSKPG